MKNPVLFPLNQEELTLEMHGGLIKRTVHPSGLRILTEEMPGSRSASIGFWVGVGSRDEQAEHDSAPASLGSTHFLEHLLFKGTPNTTAYDIARTFDKMGADHNALTAKEYTAYYAKVRDVHIEDATALLAEMVTDSLITSEEFENERGVILEELAMAEDDFADLVGERFFAAILPDHALGRPIGGNPDTIKAARRDDVWRHYQNEYLPETLVITAAGAVKHEEFVAHVLESLKKAGVERFKLEESKAPRPRRDRAEAELPEKISSSPNIFVTKKPSEQTHLMLGARGLQAGDDQRYAFGVMNSVLGGGMSSRLFQEIREKRGLAYTTYSFGASYSDAGLFGMYGASHPSKTTEVASLMLAELVKLSETGITEEEFERTIGQISGSSALALEDSDTRMGRLARAELGTGEFLDLDSQIARFEAVTASDIMKAAKTILDRQLSLVVVGDVAEDALKF